MVCFDLDRRSSARRSFFTFRFHSSIFLHVHAYENGHTQRLRYVETVQYKADKELPFPSMLVAAI